MTHSAGVAVEIEGLCKTYSTALALDGVDLCVPSGEFLVLAGPSGCGKTTILRCLAGLEEPNAGVICLDGLNAHGVPPHERGIAMVFQDHSLFPHLSIARNLALPLEVLRLPADEVNRRVQEVSRLLKIEGLLPRRPGAVSGGERQRAAIGRAIASGRPIVLMDEPLSNLDAPLRVAIREEILALHQALGFTCVYVTHDQAEAMILAQRLAVMDKGRIRQIGPPQEVYRQPANCFVAGFLGFPAMNQIHGCMEAGSFAAPGLRLAREILRLPDSVQPGARVTLGIRPEALRLSTPGAEAAPGQIRLPARVSHMEDLGRECILYLDADCGRLAVLLSDGSQPPLPDQEIATVVTASDLLWFDDQGNRIP